MQRASVYCPHIDVMGSSVTQLLEKLGQVAETMRQCANVAEEFARTMSGKTLASGVINPFSDGPSVAGAQTGKRKAQALDDDEGDGKKKKAPRKPKDPNAPKRPPSSYLLFQNEVRAELKSKYPNLPNSELLQMISKRWAAMSDEDKEVHLVSSIALIRVLTPFRGP
jgi:transcriptional regulator HMO1